MNYRLIPKEQAVELMEHHHYNQLHIHHTWKPNHKDFNGKNHLELQNAMANYHINTLHWSDIGQHLTLMPDGKYVTGRAFDRNPASIKGWNTGAFAIEMLGDFDNGHDELAKVQLDHILYIANYFGNKYGFDKVKFHREGPNVKKTCPGTSVIKNTFIEEAKKYGGK